MRIEDDSLFGEAIVSGEGEVHSSCASVGLHCRDGDFIGGFVDLLHDLIDGDDVVPGLFFGRGRVFDHIQMDAVGPVAF